MESSKFIHFTEEMAGAIASATHEIRQAFRRALTETSCLGKDFFEEAFVKQLGDFLFMSVVKQVADRQGKELPASNPEVTMAELIRLGVPKENVCARCSNLTAKLPNASYRLYRKDFGYPHGSVQVTWKECGILVHPGLSPTDLARFIFLLDSHLPEIDKAAKTILGEMQDDVRVKQAEEKALEIARKTVGIQLSDALPGMGISGHYTVSSDGKVRLHISRSFHGEIELPIEDLADFLSDTARVESTLEANPNPTITELKGNAGQSLFPQSFFSKIKTTH